MPFFNSFQENTFQFYRWFLCKYCDKLALHFGTEKLAHFFATFQNVNAFSSCAAAIRRHRCQAQFFIPVCDELLLSLNTVISAQEGKECYLNKSLLLSQGW